MPPVMGAGAFIMAQFLGVPYIEVAIAAVVPALLYYFAVMVQVHFELAEPFAAQGIEHGNNVRGVFLSRIKIRVTRRSPVAVAVIRDGASIAGAPPTSSIEGQRFVTLAAERLVMIRDAEVDVPRKGPSTAASLAAGAPRRPEPDVHVARADGRPRCGGEEQQRHAGCYEDRVHRAAFFHTVVPVRYRYNPMNAAAFIAQK